MHLKYCSLPITSYKAHTHKDWEIVCQLEGEARTQVGDQTLTVRKGDVLLIPPNTVHKGESDGIFRDISLHAEELSFPHFACFRDESSDLALLLSMIHRLHAEQEGGYRAAISTLIRAICELVQAKLRLPEGSPAVERVKRAIYDNISNCDFKPSVAIAVSGFDKDYFCRLFKRENGKTPMQFLTDLRIAQAKRLLKDPKQFSVEVIAHSCGFADALYFSTCFKKHVGLSPLAYRKNA